MKFFLSVFILCTLLFIRTEAHAGTRWQLVEADSSLSFLVSIGGSETAGIFQDWSATISYDPDTKEHAHIVVEVNIGSVSIDAPQASSLVGAAQWLGARGYPTARFVGHGFSIADDQTLTMQGMLSLKGIDVPITLVGSIEIEGGTAHAEFETTLSRSAFGVGDENPAVADPVTVRARLTAIRVAD